MMVAKGCMFEIPDLLQRSDCLNSATDKLIWEGCLYQTGYPEIPRQTVYLLSSWSIADYEDRRWGNSEM